MKVRIDLGCGHMLIHVASVDEARRVIRTAGRHGHRAILLWRLTPTPCPQECPQARPLTREG